MVVCEDHKWIFRGVVKPTYIDIKENFAWPPWLKFPFYNIITQIVIMVIIA